MIYPVFKSLDNPSSFVGLKGSYIRYAATGIGVALFIAFVIGGATNGLIGVIVFVALGALDYMGVMAFQAKFSERERQKWFSSRKLPDVLNIEPRSFRYQAGLRLDKARQKQQKKDT